MRTAGSKAVGLESERISHQRMSHAWDPGLAPWHRVWLVALCSHSASALVEKGKETLVAKKCRVSNHKHKAFSRNTVYVQTTSFETSTNKLIEQQRVQMVAVFKLTKKKKKKN